jgi:hypothetical protein
LVRRALHQAIGSLFRPDLSCGAEVLPEDLTVAGSSAAAWGQPSIFRPPSRETPPSSEELARAYKPYIETCIAAFGPDRGIAVDPPQAL